MTRILVIDDHALVRAGLCRLLDAERDMEVVGQTGSGREGIELCSELKPDLVLLDYTLSDLDGLQTTEKIMERKTGARVLVLTMHANEEYAIRVIRAGASGFVIKGAAPDELLAAIRKVARQGTYVSPSIQDKMIGRIGLSREESPEAGLSNREMQVLLRLARGATTRETADELCLSLSTVETYRSRLLEKLNCRNNSDLTRFAIRRGLIGVD
jgi:DNA-binding NarL/FixJ family response regulator